MKERGRGGFLLRVAGLAMLLFLAMALLSRVPSAGGRSQASLGAIPTVDAEQLQHEDKDYGWVIAYPAAQWSVATEWDNPPVAPYVIRRRTVFSGPLQARVIVDLWEREPGMSLHEWVGKYHNYVLAPEVEVPQTTNTMISGAEGFFIAVPGTPQSPPWLTVVFLRDGQAYRITYVVSDGGRAYDAYRGMLSSLRFLGEPAARTEVPEADLEFLKAASLLGETSCCGYSSPGNPYNCYGCGNCVWWAWYKRPDLPWFPGDANNWCNAARSANLPMGSAPSLGAIAVFENMGSNGHVAYVEEVSGGSFRISEMWWPNGCDNQCCKVCSYRWYSSASCFILPPGGSDTTDPDGDITSPSEGATITSRSVRLEGWGSDSGSGLARAHFTAYYGGSWRQVGPDFTSSPFGFDWDMCNGGVPNGQVTLGLDLWDKAGNEANSPRGNRHFTKNYDCSPPPPSCNPDANQVALFVDANYSGQCVVKGIGQYSNPSSIGLPNDSISSVKVGGNVKAILCEHDNYQGTCETFTGDDANLTDNSIGNDRVSSAKVEPRASLPSPPQLLSPANGSTFNEGDSITLSWSATGNEYYGEISGGPGGTLTFGWQSGTSKTIGSQWAGYTYSWHVKARNSAGTSGWSDTWTFTVRPAAPTGLSAQAVSCSQINLSWSDNSGNEEGYKVYRNGAYVGQVGMNATSYQDMGLSQSTTYTYYVKAYRGSTESLSSNTASATTPACPGPPPPTHTVTPTGGATSTWTPTRTRTPTRGPTSTPYTVTPLPPISIPLEAEDGGLSWPMALGLDPDASRCGYIYTPLQYKGEARYRFYIELGGTYYVWARGKGGSWSNNSFWFSLDGGDDKTWEIPPDEKGNWAWVWNTVMAGFVDRGYHTLVVKGREGNARLDRLEITSRYPGYVGPEPIIPCGTATPTSTATPTFTPIPTPTATPTPPGPANLAPNPGFEVPNASSTGPLGWQGNHWAGPAPTYNWTTNVRHSGDRAVQIINHSDETRSRWRAPKVVVQPGQFYHYRVWVKGSRIAGTARLTMVFIKADGTRLGKKDSSVVRGTFGWQRLEGAVVPPPGTKYIRLELRLHGAGTVWFDDVLLERT